MPNKKIWADTIQNVTAQRVRRVDLEVGVSYGDDVEQVENVLHEVVTGHPLVLEDPPANVRLHRLDDSAVTFIVRPWVMSVDFEQHPAADRAKRRRVVRGFRRPAGRRSVPGSRGPRQPLVRSKATESRRPLPLARRRRSP